MKENGVKKKQIVRDSFEFFFFRNQKYFRVVLPEHEKESDGEAEASSVGRKTG